MTDRTPPNAPGAEAALLGAMLLSRHAIADATETTAPEDFYQPCNETIYRAILTLYADGRPADAVTVLAELIRTGDAAKVGGGVYLHELMGACITPGNAGYHATIVRDLAVRRRMVEAGNRIAQMGYETDDGDDLAAIVDRAQSETHNLSARGHETEGVDNAATLDEVLEQIEHGTEPGLPTGFVDLDQLTGGLHPGQMWIVAARPGIGKSTVALDLVRCASIEHRHPSVFFSLEMNRRELMRRALSAEARIPLHHLAHGRMSPGQWNQVRGVYERIATAPVELDDSPDLTMMRIRTKARRLAQRKGLRLAVVDYAQLMNSGASRRHENRQTEVSAISRGLKLLAKELSIPVVVLAQLNRGPEQRADKRPMMSDLRESGALEQDADVVLLLHREDAYDRESPRAGEADFIVAKHRNGPTATIVVAFQGHYSRFVDMARDGEDRPWSPSGALAGAR